MPVRWVQPNLSNSPSAAPTPRTTAWPCMLTVQPQIPNQDVSCMPLSQLPHWQTASDHGKAPKKWLPPSCTITHTVPRLQPLPCHSSSMHSPVATSPPHCWHVRQWVDLNFLHSLAHVYTCTLHHCYWYEATPPLAVPPWPAQMHTQMPATPLPQHSCCC